MKDISLLIKKAARATEENQHTAARLMIARFFKLERAARILEHIDGIHAEEGSLPVQLSEYRDIVTRDILTIIAQEHGQDIADKLYEAL